MKLEMAGTKGSKVRPRWFSRVMRWPELLLILCTALLYLGNGQTLGSGDTLPARQLPMSILRDHNLYLDEVRASYKDAAMHSLRYVNGHWVSAYPIGAALIATPFYVPAALVGIRPESRWMERMEKISATGIVLLSVLVMCATLRRVLGRSSTATWIGAVYALCTSSLSVSSQALWQHGASQLAIASGLYCLVRGFQQPRWIAFSGLPLAFAVLSRPTNVLIVAPIALYVLVHHIRKLPAFAAFTLPVGAFLVWYNLTYFGTVLHSQFPLNRRDVWSTPFFEGLAGLLLSPGRGLFVYSPVLLLSIWGFAHAWRSSSASAPAYVLLRYGSIGAALVVIAHAKWWSWWGGICYGPRLLADILPVLCFALCPVADLVLTHRILRPITAALAVWSLLTHFQGAYWDDGHWTGYALPEGMWSWTDSPVVNPTLEIVNRARISVSHQLTSRTDPDSLSAAYMNTDSIRLIKASVGDQIARTIDVRNTGKAVWIAWPKRDKGTVVLDCRVEAENGAQTPIRQIRIPLRHDVFPGENYEFQIPVGLPLTPGRYTFCARLVRNTVSDNEDDGATTVRIPLMVRPATRGKWRDTPHPDDER